MLYKKAILYLVSSAAGECREYFTLGVHVLQNVLELVHIEEAQICLVAHPRGRNLRLVD